MVRSTFFRWPIGRQIGKRGFLQNVGPDPLCLKFSHVKRWPNHSSRIVIIMIFFVLFPMVHTPLHHLDRNYRPDDQFGAHLGVKNGVWSKSVTWTCQMVFKSLVVTQKHVFDVPRMFLLIFMTCPKSCFFVIVRVMYRRQVSSAQCSRDFTTPLPCKRECPKYYKQWSKMLDVTVMCYSIVLNDS